MAESPEECDIPEESRAAAIKGLRELAGFMEVHPGLPAPDGTDYVGPHLSAETEEQERSEVDRIARILGVKTTTSSHGGHYSASGYFGSIEYKAVAIPRERMARHAALMSYGDAVMPEAPEITKADTSTELPEEDRDAAIRGLRKLADFLEAHPDLPAPYATVIGPYIGGGTEEQKRSEVDRIARILGVETNGSHSGHHSASRYFGSIEYDATAVTREHMARYRALTTYSGAVTPEPPAPDGAGR